MPARRPRSSRKVATPFMAKRMELGMPMEGARAVRGVQQGRAGHRGHKAGLDVSSDMTKDQLAEALAGAMA